MSITVGDSSEENLPPPKWFLRKKDTEGRGMAGMTPALRLPAECICTALKPGILRRVRQARDRDSWKPGRCSCCVERAGCFLGEERGLLFMASPVFILLNRGGFERIQNPQPLNILEIFGISSHQDAAGVKCAGCDNRIRNFDPF